MEKCVIVVLVACIILHPEPFITLIYIEELYVFSRKAYEEETKTLMAINLLLHNGIFQRL